MSGSRAAIFLACFVGDLFAALQAGAAAFPQEGRWLTEDKSGIVEIAACDDSLYVRAAAKSPCR
jgi:hypothetical protein